MKKQVTTSTLRCFALQGRVIHALVLRELHTRYGRENLGFLWMIGEPMLFAIGVTILWSFIYPAREHGVPIVGLTITGYVPLITWRHCLGRSMKAFESNGSLLYHRQVTLLDILASRLILEVCGATATYIILVAVFSFVGLMALPEDYGLLYLGWAFIIAFSVGCGLVIAALSEMSETIEKVIPIVSYLYLPFSGAFTMVNWVTPKVRNILLYSPSQNALELIRGGQFGPSVRPQYDLIYTTWTCSLLILVGIALTFRARRFVVIN